MTIERSRFAAGPVVSAMAALAVVLALTASAYGYHRDELYFRVLDPAWGYIDQPPLLPLLARGAIAVFGDSVVALRVVSGVFAVASIAVLAHITREVGGNRLAQGLTAWGIAGASMTLAFGHVLLTASIDLVVWPAALLFVLRTVLRADGRWWLAAGAVVGASTSSKLLVVVLLVGVAAGLAALGPRGWFRSRWLWGGVALTAALAAPNIVYQARNGWPQLAMGTALADGNAAEVRVLMWPFLVLMVGPVLAIWWVVALVSLFRRAEWKLIRWLAITFAVVVGFVYVAGTQFYYTYGILAALVAVGSVTVARWAHSRRRRWVLVVGLVVNALGCAVTSLPVLPVETFGASGLAAVNSASADQVGWERYVEQVSSVVRDVNAEAIVTANYGEAGALDRFGDDLPPVSSGHNALWDKGSPPAQALTVVVVGDFNQTFLETRFASCSIEATLANGLGVDNEEENVPVRVCNEPVKPWSELWPDFRHLD